MNKRRNDEGPLDKHHMLVFIVWLQAAWMKCVDLMAASQGLYIHTYMERD